MIMMQNTIKKLRKNRVKWEEMTLEEKVEYMHLDGKFPDYRVLWWMGVMLIAVICVFAVQRTQIQVDNIYNQTGMKMLDYNQKALDKNWTETQNLMNPVGIAMTILVILYVYSAIRWNLDYRKFKKEHIARREENGLYSTRPKNRTAIRKG